MFRDRFNIHKKRSMFALSVVLNILLKFVLPSNGVEMCDCAADSFWCYRVRIGSNSPPLHWEAVSLDNTNHWQYSRVYRLWHFHFQTAPPLWDRNRRSSSSSNSSRHSGRIEGSCAWDPELSLVCVPRYTWLCALTRQAETCATETSQQACLSAHYPTRPSVVC